MHAEPLIVDAIATYSNSNDTLGLAEGYRVYGMFLRSKAVGESGYAEHYKEKGFLDRSATFDKRYEKSIEYYQKAEELLKSTERSDLLSNVYFHIADDYRLMHEVDNACRAYDQSLAAQADYQRDHPGNSIDLPKGYKSFSEAIAAYKQNAGC